MTEPDNEFTALILCMPVSFPMRYEGSEPGLCECCQETIVWISPMKKELRANRVNSRIVCAMCAVILSDGQIPSDEIVDIEKIPKEKFYDKKD